MVSQVKFFKTDLITIVPAGVFKDRVVVVVVSTSDSMDHIREYFG